MARMTIRDIARLAGVSVTTVSRALNNAPEINSQTRERVLRSFPRRDRLYADLLRNGQMNVIQIIKITIIASIVPNLLQFTSFLLTRRKSRRRHDHDQQQHHIKHSLHLHFLRFA